MIETRSIGSIIEQEIGRAFGDLLVYGYAEINIKEVLEEINRAKAIWGDAIPEKIKVSAGVRQ